MKKLLLFLLHFSISFVSSIHLCSSQTLPPVAQALYDEMFYRDSIQAHTVLNQGAQVYSTPDSNSFYLAWFPPGALPSQSPLIVTLHGSEGTAFAEIQNWYQQAVAHGCGILALQWYRGSSAVPPDDYFKDDVIYHLIDTALIGLSYPRGKAFLHGFSRGSARSYAIAFLDMHGGNNYFCTVLSNAGAVNPNYPLYAQIDSGNFGNNVFAGKQWALFCGGQDTALAQSGCPGMSNTQNWLTGQGAFVGIFIGDSTLGHDGFHLVPVFMDSVLNYYIDCFQGITSLSESSSEELFEAFPNPFQDNINIYFATPVIKSFSISVRNIFGEEKYYFNELKTETMKHEIHLDFLSPGAYILSLNFSDRIVNRILIKN